VQLLHAMIVRETTALHKFSIRGTLAGYNAPANEGAANSLGEVNFG